jgi:RimJ/RimL family protein N-acetyltransferase
MSRAGFGRAGAWEGREMGSSVLLPDGTPIVLRSIEPGDLPALVRFHEGLSPTTVYRRFFGFHPHLAALEAEHFCCVDGIDRFALVAIADDAIVGVGRLERIEPKTAEVAFVVADRYQHRALGQFIARQLAEVARSLGIETFVADVLPGNTPMLHLLPDAGFAVERSASDGVVRLTCPLGLAND